MTAFLIGVWGCGSAPVPREGPRSIRAASDTTADAANLIVEADLQRALELMRRRQYDQAESVLKSIVNSRDRSTVTLLNLGITYSQLGKLPEAEQSLRQALEEDPANFIAYNELGIINRKAGRFQQARDAYEHALMLRPNYALAHLNLGILCDMYLQNVECAIRHYRAYQQFGGSEDPPVDLWIDDLKRRYPEQRWRGSEGAGQ